jgi:hypothetical protein
MEFPDHSGMKHNGLWMKGIEELLKRLGRPRHRLGEIRRDAGPKSLLVVKIFLSGKGGNMGPCLEKL